MKSAKIKVWRFYPEGFKNMAPGQTLWTLLFLKLISLCVTLNLFFFPDFLSCGAVGNGEKGVAAGGIIRGVLPGDQAIV